MPPGKAVAYAPISAPPWTPEWPRIGMRPAPLRPTLPRARPTLTIAFTPSAPCSCWVIPIDQISTALGGRGVEVDEGVELDAVDAGRGEQLVEGLAVERGDELVPAFGVRGDERLVERTSGAQTLQHQVGEGDVAARVGPARAGG